jgi:hypothetical protein
MDAILKTIAAVREHSNFDPGTMHPMMRLNCAILAAYVNHVIEDESTETGLEYTDGADDESVRREAEKAFGAPIDLHQVVALRRFIGTLFTSGSFTTDDVRRIRSMFLGRFSVDAS